MLWGKIIKRAKFIYNIQDFNPEQTMAVSYSDNGLVLKAMMIADKFSCKCSDLIITVGRDLVETMNKRFKGKKLPGHMGAERVTVQNLEIVKIDAENDVILVKGSVPGPKKSLVMIKETVKSGK